MATLVKKTRRTEKRKVKLRLRKKAITYQSGGEGFIKWCHDFGVAIEVYEEGLPVYRALKDLSEEPHPVTGRCSMDMWREQQVISKEALRMVDKEFVHRLIVLCWMRGEGKSLLVCLWQLWKFTCFPSQKIMLGANSKEQSKFVHYEIMRGIILNTPKLLMIVGAKNIQEKQISLRDNKGNVVSFIRSISSFSGIVSNITGYTFSEMFDMKNPKFFTQLDGSIRNVPNALGIIDSTVSEKTHILHRLYTSWNKNLDPTLYFSHRQSKEANWKDFWNPGMTKVQLNSYKTKFPGNEFAQYFKNTWEAGSNKLFTEEMVKATNYIGYGTGLGEHTRIIKLLTDCTRIEGNEDLPPDIKEERVRNITDSFIPTVEAYSLETEYHQPRMIQMHELEHLSDLYDTDWALLVGADRADPMKRDLEKGAKTIMTAVLKGLPGSRSNPMDTVTDPQASKYIYMLAHLAHIYHSDVASIKAFIEGVHEELGGVDTFCTERWGMWDMGDWCEDLGIGFEPMSATYSFQKAAFSELFILYKQGRFKAPPLVVKGTKKEDLLAEEAMMFDHNKSKKFYGSPEKGESSGVQDDSMFSLGWTIYGGRMLTTDNFRSRFKNDSFGEFYKGEKLVGRY